MKGAILLGIFIALNFSFICFAGHLKYPAEVYIMKAESSVNYNFTLEIEGKYRKWKLQLTPLENIWSGAAQTVSVSEKENGTSSFKIKNNPKNVKAYEDAKFGSILSVKGHEVTGILDVNYSIVCENDNHFIIKLNREVRKDFNDSLALYSTVDYYDIYSEEEMGNKTIISDNNSKISEDSEKAIYTPEIAVVIDSALSKIIGDDSKIIDYLTVYFNDIKKRFQSIQDVIVKITLVGCVIIRSPSLESFLKTNDPSKNGDILDQFGKWIFSNYYLLPAYDIMVLLTNKEWGFPLFGTSVCKKEIASRRSISITIENDVNAIYSECQGTALRLGSLMGAQASDPDCDNKGYVMSYEALFSFNPSKNSYTFSKCSAKQIADHLSRVSASCVRTQINRTRPVGVFSSTILPGKLISMDEQCKYLTNDIQARVDANVKPEDKLCVNLRCIRGDNNYQNTQIPSLKGSRCPSGKRCANERCA